MTSKGTPSRSLLQAARLKALSSHRSVMEEAAAACVADWPSAGSWEQQAQLEGRWIEADPMAQRSDAADEMTRQREIARLTREALLELIQPVQLLSVKGNKATGAVAGAFRSNGVLFNFSIKDQVVRYGPAAPSGRREDADDSEGWTGVRMDAGKPRNCSKGFSCGSTCIQKGRNCRAKGGAAAEKLGAIVKYTGGGGGGSAPAAAASAAASRSSSAGGGQGSGKAPSLRELKAGVLGVWEAKSVQGLKADKNFQMAMAGDENPLRTKDDWLKLYRRFVGVPKNERNLPDGPTTINGIDVLKNFRPWTVFGLDPKTATNDDIRQAFRKAIIKHHPDQGGDPRVAARLKVMRDSLLAMRPDEPRAKARSRRDAADRDPRAAGYLEVMDRLRGFRLDGAAAPRMDAIGERVSPAVVAATRVLQGLAGISARMPHMAPSVRAQAVQAQAAALRVLQSAGIDPQLAWAEAI